MPKAPEPMKRIPIASILVLWLMVTMAGRGRADWPHWRGPHRNGFVDEPSGWEPGRRWCADKPLWQVNVGQGSTSPLVVDGRVYVMGWRDQRDIVQCLNAATGSVIWRVDYASTDYGRYAIGDKYFYGGPTSTPEYDTATGLLYTLSVDGELRCWDTTRGGELLWRVNLYDRYGVPQRKKLTRHGHRDYGYTSAPYVHHDWVIVEVGAPKAGNVIAFDKRSGEERWRSESRDPAGHAGGFVPLQVGGVACLAHMSQKHLLVTALDGDRPGKLVGAVPWVTDYANSVASPGVLGSQLFPTSNYNVNAIARIDVTAMGAKEVWRQPHPSKVCSPVVIENEVYFVWRDFWCIDRRTGEVKWRAKRTFGDPGSLIVTSDRRLVAWTGNGRLTLVENAQRSPDRYRELASSGDWFRELAWPHVVLSDGRFYLKDRMGNLICLPLAVRSDGNGCP